MTDQPNTVSIVVKTDPVDLKFAKELQALVGRPVRLRTATHTGDTLVLGFQLLDDGLAWSEEVVRALIETARLFLLSPSSELRERNLRDALHVAQVEVRGVDASEREAELVGRVAHLEAELRSLAHVKDQAGLLAEYALLEGEDLVQHLRMGFRLLAAGMFQGIEVEMGGEQHRDLVRVFLAGAMTARPPDDHLEKLVEMVCREGWRPPRPWNWGSLDRMEAEANEDNRRAQRRRRRS